MIFIDWNIWLLWRDCGFIIVSMKSWSRNHASRAFIHFLPLLKKVTLWVRQFIAKYSAKITFIRLFRYLFCCFSGKIESFQCFTVIPIGYSIFTAQKMKFPINPNLGVLFRGSFWGGGGGMGVKITPHPRQKLVRVMLETSNLWRKYTHM